MSHFAILAPEMAGHLFPLGALGCELRRRGHQVTLVARAKAATIARQLDLPLCQFPADDVPWQRTFPPAMLAAGWSGLDGHRPRPDASALEGGPAAAHGPPDSA